MPPRRLLTSYSPSTVRSLQSVQPMDEGGRRQPGPPVGSVLGSNVTYPDVGKAKK